MSGVDEWRRVKRLTPATRFSLAECFQPRLNETHEYSWNFRPLHIQQDCKPTYSRHIFNYPDSR